MPSSPTGVRRPLGLVVALLGICCVYAIRQADPDLFGYLAYGRLFSAQGWATDVDPFAFTSAGAHWIAFEYLAQLTLWAAYDHFGPLGLIGLKLIVGGSAVFLLGQAVRLTSDAPTVWVPVFLLCTTTLSRFFVFRPQLFTFAAFAFFTVVGLRYLLQRRAALWALPVTMLLWANVHGGFLAGLGVIGLTAVLQVLANLNREDGNRRPLLERVPSLLYTFGACLAATLVSPHPVGLWRYVLAEVGHGTNRRYIAEWQPISWSRDPWSATALVVVAALLMFVGLAAQRRRASVAGVQPWQWALSCVPLLAMSCLSVRHVPLAVIWAGPIIALLATAAARGGITGSMAVGWLIVSAVSLVPVVLTVEYVAEHPWPAIATGGQVLGTRDPCRAVGFLRRNGVTGNIYNPLWWGGYLTWMTYPNLRVSMDGRNISLFPPSMVEENLRFYSDDVTPDDRDAPVRRGSDFLLVPANVRVLDWIRHDARRQVIYSDADASLFVRADAAHPSTIERLAARSFLAPAPCDGTLR
jgi:hypothetical protein